MKKKYINSNLFDDELSTTNQIKKSLLPLDSKNNYKSNNCGNSSSNTSTKPSKYSVTDITSKIKNTLEQNFNNVWITGEVSNIRRQPSGHVYFTLKDDKSSISCVIFRSYVKNDSLIFDNGDNIEIHGDISVYSARGQYQIIVKKLLIDGSGSLQAEFEKLKQKLYLEGLFDKNNKKLIPQFPQSVAIITSESGAALRDILYVLKNRSPWLNVYLFTCLVQGDLAVNEIISALKSIQHFSNLDTKIDTVIIARGGGSIEDLWCFNDEKLARNISNFNIPIISGVGHEIDFTITDFVSDLRAPTPSVAAELCSPDKDDLNFKLNSYINSLSKTILQHVKLFSNRLDIVKQNRLFIRPIEIIMDNNMYVDDLLYRLNNSITINFNNHTEKLSSLSKLTYTHDPTNFFQTLRQKISRLSQNLETLHLHSLSLLSKKINLLKSKLVLLNPNNVLSRGFTITKTIDGKLISSCREIKTKQKIITHLSDGEISSEVI